MHEEFQAAATKEQLEKVNVLYFLFIFWPQQALFLRFWEFTVFVATAFTSPIQVLSNKHGPSSIPKNHPVWPHARLGGVNTNYSTYFFVIFESSHIAANKLYFLKFQKIQNFDCALSAKIQF